jgi:transcriptional/translational regulatory protein YebC/TACO1
MESLTYEGYGPGGAGIIIEVLTDNRNRTAPEIKHLLSKHGGNLGAIGSVTWAFEKSDNGFTATSEVTLNKEDSEKLLALMEEIENNDDVQEVFTNAILED